MKFEISGTMRILAGWIIVFLLMGTSFGCTGLPARNPVPVALVNDAAVAGIPNARFWADELPEELYMQFKTSSEADVKQNFFGVYQKAHNYLAISGGGANGAFGAGLLAGWTVSGSRPEFTMVTGISTGALTAPFAFLGPEYDEVLEEVYTGISTNNIGRRRNFLTRIFSVSIVDTQPLRTLIEHYIDTDIIAAIAREDRKGRRLFIGTVNLDAGRPVIWNIGAIAASEHPGKLELIHDVLQASSALPIVFPPQVITVNAKAKTYDEMHVDGGIGAQVFVYPATINWKLITEKLKVPGTPNVFVIRNGSIYPDFASIEQRKLPMLPIGIRSIDSLLRSQGLGDIFRIYALCLRDGYDFNLAFIPADFKEESNERFDPVYMGKLFDLGYQMAKSGFPWMKSPPGVTSSYSN
ncbi:MAG: patatin-like phospholipase family protein [Desulfobulbaceae bacterium]|jgi:predicted patatin/cPLA2 family phospholipase|nr:patatin-like phospholipase family protein [Desulfobulbaceae bacterium]MDH3781736.1 patatin-like phospholipase family protein [Desulfobulbaceae bacterium]